MDDAIKWLREHPGLALGALAAIAAIYFIAGSSGSASAAPATSTADPSLQLAALQYGAQSQATQAALQAAAGANAEKLAETNATVNGAISLATIQAGNSKDLATISGNIALSQTTLAADVSKLGISSQTAIALGQQDVNKAAAAQATNIATIEADVSKTQTAAQADVEKALIAANAFTAQNAVNQAASVQKQSSTNSLISSGIGAVGAALLSFL